MRLSSLHAVLIAAIGFVPGAWADSVALDSVADTTLIALMPDNNMGGHNFFNAGTTLHGSKNRGLLRFDVTAGIPSGSKIVSAQVILEVVGIPIDEPAGTTFGLHRLLRPWGEGNKTSVTGPGRGDTATIGEATWNHRFAITTNNWAVPGGLAGTDFSAVASGEQFLEPSNNSAYTFGSSTRMIEDVQGWLDNPESNHGWLIKTEDEELRTTARRFASKEDSEYGPQLLIEYLPPPLLEVSRSGSELRLSFVAQANQSYALETAETVSSQWMSISNITATAETRAIHLTNSISGNAAFFRVLVSE